MKRGVYFSVDEYVEEFKDYPGVDEAKNFIRDISKFAQDGYVKKSFLFYTGFIKNAALFPGDYATAIFGYAPPGTFVDFSDGMYEISVYGADMMPILTKEFDSAEKKEEAENFFERFQSIVPCAFQQLETGFLTGTFPLVKNNDGRLFCYWCSAPTKTVNTGRSFWNICTKCGR